MAKSKVVKKKKFGYVITSQSYYMENADELKRELILGKKVSESICIFDLDKNNESSFEFMLDWHSLNGESVPQLSLFEDSWKAFKEMPELFKVLGKYQGKCPSPQKIIVELKKLKYVDRTERKRRKSKYD